MGNPNYKKPQVPDSVWEIKDRGNDAQKALAWATQAWLSEKDVGDRSIEEIADGMYIWLRKRRANGHPLELKEQIAETPFY